MKIFLESVVTFLEEDNGATGIEYALLASIIAVGAYGGFTALGGALAGTYTRVAAAFGS